MNFYRDDFLRRFKAAQDAGKRGQPALIRPPAIRTILPHEQAALIPNVGEGV